MSARTSSRLLACLALVCAILSGCGRSDESPKPSVVANVATGSCSFEQAVRSATGVAQFAVLVGVAHYRHESILDLKAPLRDVADMYALLTRAGGYQFAPRNVCLLADESATADGFRDALRTLAVQARPGDTVLIYFAGHGTQLPDTNHDEPDLLDEALMFVDSRQTQRGTLLDDELAELLEPLRKATGNVVVILDACTSGSATRAPTSEVLASRYQAPRAEDLAAAVASTASRGDASSTWFAETSPGLTTLAAAVDGTVAIESQGQGVFTQALTRVLLQIQGRALTYRDLARKVPPLLAARSNQVPLFQGELDRVVFGVTTRTRPAVLEITSIGPPIQLGGVLLPGLGTNAELRVFSSSATGTDFNDPAKSKAILVVDRATGFNARAHVAAVPDQAAPLEPGDLAVLLRPADEALALEVRLRPAAEPGGIPRSRAAQLRQALRDNAEAAKLVELSDARADFELASDPSGSIYIIGPEGRVRNVVASDAAVVENLWLHARQRAFLNLRGEGGAGLTDDQSLVVEVIGVDQVPDNAEPQLPCVRRGARLLRNAQGGYIMPLCYSWRIKVALAAGVDRELRVGGVLLSSDGSMLGFPAGDQAAILSPGQRELVFSSSYTAGLPIGIDDHLLVFGTQLDDPVNWKLLTQTARQRGTEQAPKSALHAALDRYIGGAGTRGHTERVESEYEARAWTRTSISIRVEPNLPPLDPNSLIEDFDIRPYLPDDPNAALHRVLVQAHELTAAREAQRSDGARAVWSAFTQAGLRYSSDNNLVSAAQMLSASSAMGQKFRRCPASEQPATGDLLVYRGAGQSGQVLMVIDAAKRMLWGAHDAGLGYRVVESLQDRAGMPLAACWRYQAFGESDELGLAATGRRALANPCDADRCAVVAQ